MLPGLSDAMSRFHPDRSFVSGPPASTTTVFCVNHRLAFAVGATASPRKTSPASSSGSSPERTTVVVFVLPCGPTTSSTGIAPKFGLPPPFFDASWVRAAARMASMPLAGVPGFGVRSVSRMNQSRMPALARPSTTSEITTGHNFGPWSFSANATIAASTRYAANTPSAMSQVFVERFMGVFTVARAPIAKAARFPSSSHWCRNAATP